MYAFKRWVAAVAGAMCCALLGTVRVPGVAGAAGGSKWAVVNSTGALVRGHGATFSARLGPGVYRVLFTSDMTHCAFEATAGGSSSSAVSGPVQTTVSLRSNPNELLIKTFDLTAGGVADASFHVATYCGAAQSFAVVGSDGITSTGSHVVSSSRFSQGNYGVVFDHNVSRCAFTVSDVTTAVGGPISVAGLFSNKAGVFVQTLSSAGDKVDRAFHLAVDCGANKDFAVINAAGSKARGAHVTSSANLEPGEYEVVFDRDVTKCAYTATIGTTTNGGSIDDPAVITTASRSGNATGVFLDVQDATGVPVDEPFHLKVTC